jgi:hypothetical protein
LLADNHLWQLGTAEGSGTACECFYRLPGGLSGAGRERLAAYRSALLVYGLSRPPESGAVPCVSLLEIVRLGESLPVARGALPGRRGSEVRFDAHSGVLWAGEIRLGEVPVHSREYYFLACLARDLDRFVAYQDIKHFVLRHAGRRDSTDEATFAHRLKNRIKKSWVPEIDLLISTTNKGDGYRLRGHVGSGRTPDSRVAREAGQEPKGASARWWQGRAPW